MTDLSDIERQKEQAHQGTLDVEEEAPDHENEEQSLEDWFIEPIRGAGRPAGGYLNESGKRVLSASTLADSFGYKGRLVDWAKRFFYDGALEGKTFEELNERDTDIGSLVHEMIVADVHDDPLPEIPDEYKEAVESSYAAWAKWMTGQKLTVVATELPLVSFKHRIGGTLDAVLRDSDGNLAIGDWKTSKKLRASYLVQVAIYGMLWNSNFKEKITGGFYVIRFSKEHQDLEYRHFPSLDDALEQALLLRRAYDNDALLKKRAGE